MAAEKVLLPALDGLGAVLVAVSHQTTGLAEFQQKYFKRGEIYVDESKAFFTALGDRYAQPEHMEDAEVLRAGKAAYKALKSKDSGYKISMAGEGALLGGSVVIGGPMGERLPVFVHLESKFGDVADPADLLAAVKGGESATTGKRVPGAKL